MLRMKVLEMKHGYIGEFESVDDHRSGEIMVISPRFDVPINIALLPSPQGGYVVLTTCGDIINNEEDRRKNLGGKIL